VKVFWVWNELRDFFGADDCAIEIGAPYADEVKFEVPLFCSGLSKDSIA
jgi:hypothetical protein